MIEYERTRDTLEAVGLLFCAQNLDAHLEKAVRETPTYITFLCQLLDAESEARKQRSEETRLKLSRLPQKKTLADSDFSFQPGWMND